MSAPHLPVDNLGTETMSSSKSANAPQYSSKDGALCRKAIDGSAVVGSLYDARTDRIVGNVSLTKTPGSKISYKAARCDLLRGNESNCEDLFHMVDIDEEL